MRRKLPKKGITGVKAKEVFVALKKSREGQLKQCPFNCDAFNFEKNKSPLIEGHLLRHLTEEDRAKFCEKKCNGTFLVLSQCGKDELKNTQNNQE